MTSRRFLLRYASLAGHEVGGDHEHLALGLFNDSLTLPGHFNRSTGVIRVDALQQMVREDFRLPPDYGDLAGVDPL
ncbi:MAG: hypothetical protein FJ121_07330 [Deltaproteobacteria bacterium]|nr:hypothetical protein [Deltaproteobacteria bacterium]